MNYMHDVEREITGTDVDELWEVVESGFEVLDGKSLFAQKPTFRELEEMLCDDSTIKLVTRNTDSGAFLQLSAIHTEPETVGWVDEKMLEELYGNQIDAGAFRYYGITVKKPLEDYRGGLSHILAGVRAAVPSFAKKSIPMVIGLDHSSHNYDLMRRIGRYFERTDSGYSVNHVASSRYYFIDPNHLDNLGDSTTCTVPENYVNQHVKARLLAKLGLEGNVSIVHNTGILCAEGSYPIRETTVYTQFVET